MATAEIVEIIFWLNFRLIVLVEVSKDDLFVFLYGLAALWNPSMDSMDLCMFWINGICESIDSMNLNIL